MATMITSNDSGFTAISLAKGEVFYSKFMVPQGIENFATVERTQNGSTKITAMMNIIVVVEGLHQSLRGAKHVRLVREDRGSELGLRFLEPKPFPKLRAALRNAGVHPTHTPGGFTSKLVVGYGDEIAVPNFTMSGSNGWIIRRADIDGFLKALPALKDSGQTGMVWIDLVGWINRPDDCRISVVDQDPSGEPWPQVFDRPRGYSVPAENRMVFRVEYDLGSLRVTKIVELCSGTEQSGAPYKVHPVARVLEVGRRLPDEIRPRTKDGLQLQA